MARFELSFTPTFYHESLNLPRHISKTITKKLEILADDPYSARGDAKKLKGYDNVYRVRVGDYRVCYSIGKGWVKLLSVRKRDERTYEDDLPAIVPPESPPDPCALASKAHDVVEEEFVLSAPPINIPPLAGAIPPSRPLPAALTEDMLARWRIPAQFRAMICEARTEDDLLNLPIPERYMLSKPGTSAVRTNTLPSSATDDARRSELRFVRPFGLSTCTGAT